MSDNGEGKKPMNESADNKGLFTGLGLIIRDAFYILLMSAILSLLLNLIHPNAIPYIAEKNYQTLVPCPEPGGPVTPVKHSDPQVFDSKTVLVDARSEKDYRAWKVPDALHIAFDYLEPVPPELLEKLSQKISEIKARRVVVYGSGGNPDSGEQLAKEISAFGIKNVFFVLGGVETLRDKNLTGDEK